MAEVIGSVSAVTSLLGQLLACSKDVHRFCHNVKYARRDTRSIQREVLTCTHLSGIFNDTIEFFEYRKSTTMENARKRGLEQLLQTQAKSAHEQIRALFNRLKPLDKKVQSSVLEQTWARVRWHFSKDDINLSMATLGSVKNSLILLSSILKLELLNSQALQNAEFNPEKYKEELKHLKYCIRQTENALREDIRKLGHNHQHEACIANLDKIKETLQPLKDESVSQARKVTRALSMSSSTTSTRTRRTSNSSSQRYNAPSSMTTAFSFTSNSRSGDLNIRHGYSNDVRVSPNNPERAIDIIDSHDTETADSQALVLWNRPNGHADNDDQATDDSISEWYEFVRVPVYRDYGDGQRENFMRIERHQRHYPEESAGGSTRSSSVPSPTTLSQTFVPMPPFNAEDLREFRRRRNGMGGGNDHLD